MIPPAHRKTQKLSGPRPSTHRSKRRGSAPSWRCLLKGAATEDFEWQYCFQSLERLLAQLCGVLSDQLCAGLLRPAAAASEARKTVQP
jgi:hypothetical protein